MTSLGPKVCRKRLEKASSRKMEHFGTCLVAVMMGDVQRSKEVRPGGDGCRHASM